MPREAAHEMIELSQRMETVLRDLYHPDGIGLFQTSETGIGLRQ